jgi:hypothetical protein
MNSNEISSRDLSGLAPCVLVKYLLSRGWILLNSVKTVDIAILQKTTNGRLEEIAVPRNQEFADYYQGIEDAIRRIAFYEKRSMGNVLSDLVASHSDVLRIRITGKNVEGGSIPFLDERAIMEGFKKVLTASACYVVDPKPFYSKLHRSEAEQLIRNCRLGTSETGSYIINVQIPMYDAKYQNKDVDKPFARKVSEYLMKSLSRVIASVEQQNTENATENSGLNANLCFGIVEMNIGDSKTNLDFQMSWCVDIPVENDVPTKVTVYDNYIPDITKLALTLKPFKEATKNTFIGKVISLNGVENEDGQMEGDVVFSLLVDEESLKAKGFLKAEFYRDACDAHKDSKYIKISAILREKPRVSDLDQISVLEEFSE